MLSRGEEEARAIGKDTVLLVDDDLQSKIVVFAWPVVAVHQLWTKGRTENAVSASIPIKIQSSQLPRTASRSIGGS